MNEQAAPPPEKGIPAQDWERTPGSVHAVVLTLYPLRQEVAKLREAVNRNSGNSSQPPSSDGPGKMVKGKPKRRGGRRGWQLGHLGP